METVDRWQQRTPTVARMFAVVKKFGDDRGSSLAALLAYYGFVSLFPLLLVLTTILGFTGNARLESGLIASTLKQFPVYGEQIGRDVSHPLQGSAFALIAGLLVLVYGSLGITQAAQYVMAEVWNIPGKSRPGFAARLGRSLLCLVAFGTAMGVTTVVSAFGTAGGHGLALHFTAVIIALVLNEALFVALFRALTPKQIPTRHLVPGALIGAVGYSALLLAGTALIEHQLRHSQAVYGQYGFVLGLIAWLYLVAEIVVYAAEINVVRVRREWPRSILEPALIDADKRVLADIARQEERRPEEHVGVAFESNAVASPAADAAEGARREALRG